MTQYEQDGSDPNATDGPEHGATWWNGAEPDEASAPDGPRRRGTEQHGASPTQHSRRGLLRVAVGGAAAVGVAGIGYAAFRLGSGKGPAGTDADSGSAASPSVTAGPTGARSTESPAAQTTTLPGFDDSSLAGPYVYRRQFGPDRTIVATAAGKQVAVLTDGARTVAFTGRTRMFSEPSTTTATVTTDAWVRLAPQRWSEGAQDDDWFESWFGEQVASDSPDLFGLYAEYAAGAPNRYDQGVRYAGAAKFGVLTSSGGYQNPLGDRDDRADFYDYLGVSYDFTDGVGKPHGEWYGDLDCSGLVRILYGYRMGHSMYLGDGPSGGSDILPRHSYSMAAGGPGPVLFGEGARSAPAADELGTLQAGDLLFFAEGSDPSSVDHCGIYFGTDQYGRRRFLSSRMGANGPTFGDAAGMSVIGGTGVYSRAMRGARRI